MRRLLPTLAALLTLAPPAAAAPPERLREQAHVTVSGVAETWRLVWLGKTHLACGPDDVTGSVTCPCSGFAYGEGGRLALVRVRNGREVERLNLGAFFDSDFDYPASEGIRGEAYLQRWPERSDDLARENKDDPRLHADILRRPKTHIMRFGDYDHDGRPTEFLLQIGTAPCGKHEMIAIGLSTAAPNLHAFASTTNPKTPLVMPIWAWEALLKSGKRQRVDTWPCGDHGAEQRSEVVLSARAGAIGALERSFTCPAPGEVERLVESSEH